MDHFQTVIVSILVLLAVAGLLLYLDGRKEKKVRAAFEGTTDARLVGHDKQLETVTAALSALAPHDARPTTAHRARFAAAPALAALARAAPDVPALAAPASGPGAVPPPGPRMRVDIRPTGFASNRFAVVYTSATDGQTLTLDARDVDERTSTMAVQVLEATARPDEVLVAFPAERLPPGIRIWVPRALVLDLEHAPPPVPPPAPVETQGDRAGINPGDELPGAPPAPAFEGCPRIKAKIEDGVFISERSVSFVLRGATIVLFVDERSLDATEGTMLVHVVEEDGADLVVDLPGEMISVGGRRVRLPRDMILGLPDDEKTGAFSREDVAEIIKVALDRPASGTRDSRDAIGAALAAVEPVPSADEVRARFEAEADERDARDAARAGEAAPPPPRKPPAPPTPIAARRATLLGVAPEDAVPRPPRPRHATSPTLVSAGNTPPAPPPSSKPRTISLDRIADLSATDLARVDALAEAHHVTREAMLAILADTDLAERERRTPGLTLVPRVPSNVEPTPPPPLDVRVERRWHELLATAQAEGKYVLHCSGSVCLRDGFTVGPCPCECEGCARIKDLLAQAKREIARERGRE